MKLSERVKAATAAFRGKSLGGETYSMDRLLEFLGLSDTPRKAQNEATYYACMKVLSEAIGKLPVKVQHYTTEGGIRIAREHPYYQMLNERPNRFMTSGVFWSLMEQCRNHYGNAYALIDTNDPHLPQLWPLDPRNVQVVYDNAQKFIANVTDIYYKVSTPEGLVVFSSEEVLHFKTFDTVNGLVGRSVREQLASTIQSGVKAQEMVNDMYDSGMTSAAVLQYTGDLNDKNTKTLVEGVQAYLQNKSKKGGLARVLPIPVGSTLTPLNMKLADSQFMELKQYTALQIASAFGVKPYQVGDYTKSSYASAEAQQLSFLVDTLLYIIKQYEEEIAYKLLTSDEQRDGFHVKFNVGVLLRADQKTQIETLVSAVSNFLLTPNEAREQLDRPWMEGGDQLLGNGSTIPVTDIGKQWETKPQAEEPDEEQTDTEEETVDNQEDGQQDGGDPDTDDHKNNGKKGGQSNG